MKRRYHTGFALICAVWPGAGKQAPSAPVQLSVGDRVRHMTFGEGTLLSVTPMGGDSLLEIAFDRVGTKKIMANFARIRKV